MRAKGLDIEDRPVRRDMVEHTRKALMRLEVRGQVRKIITGPEAWWELVG